MERIGRKKKSSREWVVASALMLAALPAIAGTVMAPTQVETPNNNGAFPPSRFGMPPARANVGLSDRFAARETEENWDELPAARDWDGKSASYGGVWDERERGGNLASTRGRSPASGGGASSSASDAAGTPNPETQEFEIRRKGVQEVALIANDLGYYPKTFFVTRDIPVRLFVTGASKNTLCIMMDTFGVRKQVKAQKVEEITFTPSVPGQYRFHCPVNGMEGVMVVKELAGQSG